MLPSQPLAEPILRVPIHGTVGLAYRTQLEIVRPPSQTLVEGANHVLLRQVRTLSARHLADGATNALHRFLRRSHPKIGALSPKRVALTDGVTQKHKRLAGHATDACLPFVDRQLEPLHHAPHDVHRRCGGATTADYEVVSIIDDLSQEPLLMTRYLPTEHEPTHVKVRQ